MKAHSGRLTVISVSAELWEKASLLSTPFLLALPTVTGSTCHVVSWGQNPCVFILSSPALCSFIFTGPGVVFVLGALFMHIAGGPVFT